eukprot:gene4962-6323_t
MSTVPTSAPTTSPTPRPSRVPTPVPTRYFPADQGDDQVLCDLSSSLNPAARGRGGWKCTGSTPSTPICSGSVSNWGGVVCSNGNVVSILLAGLKMVGTIPTSIGLLSTLTSLSISRNSITSTVPSQLGQLKLLATIDLSVNSITGYVPKTLCSDSALTSLSFGGNPLGCYFNCLSSVTSLSTGTINPVCSDAPSVSPTSSPTGIPTTAPTAAPTNAILPTSPPTSSPSLAPVVSSTGSSTSAESVYAAGYNSQWLSPSSYSDPAAIYIWDSANAATSAAP